VRQLQDKSVSRRYMAIACGEMTGGRTIDLPIGRHSVQRTKMAVNEQGKDAVTHIRLLKRFRQFSHVSAELETGRTHQIRVHMSHIGYPLLGDPVYGGRKNPAGGSELLKATIKSFQRQALHACALGLVHPATEAYMEWQQDAPQDLANLLTVLEKEAAL
jgi:23S rRNA pseudouridine1911/1915/1917 synthase